jgi:hypothetical protein
VIHAVAWGFAVAAAEALARGAIRSRSAAWTISYGALWLVAGRPRAPTTGSGGRTGVAVGLALSLVGYPLGRRLLGDTPSGPPPDPLPVELAALGVVVPAVEEAIWGARVEPEIGVAGSAALFAAKHVALDGRWRRALGLGALWVGLGLLRRRSPGLAAGVHHACNAGGVLLGHATGRDRF